MPTSSVKLRSMTQRLFSLLLTFSFLPIAQAQTWATDPNCQPAPVKEDPLLESDFSWNTPLSKLLEVFQKTYVSPKRLQMRAYWNSEKKALILPYLPERGGDVTMNSQFVKSLQSHIEQAFQKKYVDAIFFPDMGHSHILVPQKKWDQIYNHYPVNEYSRLYTDLFADPQIKVLYHTAEMVQTLDENKQVLDDPKVLWRHQTRNIVAALHPKSKIEIHQNPESAANTVGEVPGYFWYSAGYILSSHEKGCLAYRKNGKVLRYDLSLFDLPSAH